MSTDRLPDDRALPRRQREHVLHRSPVRVRQVRHGEAVKRRCLVCARPTGGRHRLCRSCHAEVEVKVEDVALRSGRVLRLCAYQNGHSRRIIVSLLDHTESVAGYVAGFDAEQAPSVRAAPRGGWSRAERKKTVVTGGGSPATGGHAAFFERAPNGNQKLRGES